MGLRVLIDGESKIQDAVEKALYTARNLEFSELELNMIASSVSEVSTNIVKYADKGELTITHHQTLNRVDFDFVDQGPGIACVEQCVKDGFTTSQTSLGLGLGATKRAMNYFNLTSQIGKGTTLSMSKWPSFLSSQYEYGFAAFPFENTTAAVMQVELNSKQALFGVFYCKFPWRAQKLVSILEGDFPQCNVRDLYEVQSICDDLINSKGFFDGVKYALILIDDLNYSFYTSPDEVLFSVFSSNDQGLYSRCQSIEVTTGVQYDAKEHPIFVLETLDQQMNKSVENMGGYHSQIIAENLLDLKGSVECSFVLVMQPLSQI